MPTGHRNRHQKHILAHQKAGKIAHFRRRVSGAADYGPSDMLSLGHYRGSLASSEMTMCKGRVRGFNHRATPSCGGTSERKPDKSASLLEALMKKIFSNVKSSAGKLLRRKKQPPASGLSAPAALAQSSTSAPHGASQGVPSFTQGDGNSPAAATAAAPSQPAQVQVTQPGPDRQAQAISPGPSSPSPLAVALAPLQAQNSDLASRAPTSSMSATVEHELRESLNAAFTKTPLPRLGQVGYRASSRSPWNVMAAGASFHGKFIEAVDYTSGDEGQVRIYTSILMGNSDSLTCSKHKLENRKVDIGGGKTVCVDQGNPEWVKVWFLSSHPLKGIYRFGDEIKVTQKKDGVAVNDTLVSPPFITHIDPKTCSPYYELPSGDTTWERPAGGNVQDNRSEDRPLIPVIPAGTARRGSEEAERSGQSRRSSLPNVLAGVTRSPTPTPTSTRPQSSQRG
jgi:hypothetical protein